jgi:predicted transcriptional regulator
MRKQREKLQNRLSPATGPNIRKYRQQQNMTCSELARVVGISPSFLSCLELGKRKGTNYTILKSDRGSDR